MMARSVSEFGHLCLSESTSCPGSTAREALGGQSRADRRTEGLVGWRIRVVRIPGVAGRGCYFVWSPVG